MATIKHKESSLNRKRAAYLLFEILGVILLIGTRPIYVIFHNMYISLILAIFSFFIIIYYAKQRKIYSYGIKGEKEVAELLSTLPKEYIIYNDIVVGDKSRGAQIDHLVLSPYGIFCIETKNMKGTIIGREEEDYWIQKKIGKGGGAYERKFYNPCKQSRGHVNAIKNILRHSDFNGVLVKSIVVFSAEKDVRLHVSAEVALILKASSLITYLKNKTEVIISKDKLKRIENVIDKNLY